MQNSDRELERRLRVLERDMVRQQEIVAGHVRECVTANERAARFQKEMRGYAVAIFVAMIALAGTIIGSGRFHF